MGMRIGEKTFKEAFKVEKQNKFMRGAVSSAQDGLRVKKIKSTRRTWQLGRMASTFCRNSSTYIRKLRLLFESVI